MTCEHVDALIEPIAAGDITPDTAVAAHLATCARCAAALALARRLERALADRTPARATPQFTRAVLARVRRDRWSSEQALDRWFNVVMAIAAALIVGGVWTVLNLTGLAAVLGDAAGVLGEGLRLAATRASAAAATYVAAVFVLGSALVAWWWAERKLTP